MRELLSHFPRPSHYAGFEEGIYIKDPDTVTLRIALAFPDTYEVGMSYLGQKILYNIVNSQQNWWAERVMAPEREVGEILISKHSPLCTLECDTPLNLMDAVGFSITHELCYTDVLRMLDLGQIPLRAKDRPDDLKKCPLIMAGGGAILGAEPLMPFLDLAALGDGEELLPQILSQLEESLAQGEGRKKFLEKARHIPGVYVPSFFQHDDKGHIKPCIEGYRPGRRIVADLNNAIYPSSQVMPIGAVHNRLTMEIARGCTRSCRFCHAGMVYRPARERNPENINAILNDCLNKTGFEELSFLALSAGDYSALKTLYKTTSTRCNKEQISISLPSLRVGSIDDEIMASMAAIRRTGCTLAPEAGSQRLRNVINKGITEEEIILHSRKLLVNGWRQVKLYFMIGLPTETDEDLKAIAELCKKVRDAGGGGAPKLQVTASLSPFVPKPFTPFQWEEQIPLEEIKRRIMLVLELVRRQKSINLRWHNPESSFLEGILSRADRRMADVVEKAYHKGAFFCSWQESFTLEPWLAALEECGLDPQELLKTRRTEDPLPWDHLEAGIKTQFLLNERKRAYDGKITSDCRYSACNQCGACDKATPSLLARDNSIEPNPVFQNRLVLPGRDQQSHQPEEDEKGKIILKNTKQARPQINPDLTIKAAHFRIWHKKTNNFAFLSQLDLQAALARYLRRADLPVAFSQGFHPMPLVSFGRALPVGMESDLEWFALTLYKKLEASEIKLRFNRVMPPDLKVDFVEQTTNRERTEQAVEEGFSLLFKDKNTFDKAVACFKTFTNLPEYILTRETKKGSRTENIRPFILDWSCEYLTQNEITFKTNWRLGYLSPLLLAQTILAPQFIPEDIKLKKISQIFISGKQYPKKA